MLKYELRDQVRRAFKPVDSYAYCHISPFQYTNYIDGMFHVGILCAASLMVHDRVTSIYAAQYLTSLINMGKDVRNFATFQVDDSWVESETKEGYWVKVKPQSFAGPMALWLANKHGAGVKTKWVPDPTFKARVFCNLGWMFGYAARYIRGLKQHVNSIFLAYLLLDKKPPKSMMWLAYNNPFYMLIYKIKLETDWPLQSRYTKGVTEEREWLTQFKDRKPGAWPAKNWPYSDYVLEGEKIWNKYIPTCQLSTMYMQEAMF